MTLTPLRVPARRRAAVPAEPPPDVCALALLVPVLHRVAPLSACSLNPLASTADPQLAVLGGVLDRLVRIDPTIQLAVSGDDVPLLYAAACGSMCVVPCGPARPPRWNHCIRCWRPPLLFDHTCHTWVR